MSSTAPSTTVGRVLRRPTQSADMTASFDLGKIEPTHSRSQSEIFTLSPSDSGSNYFPIKGSVTERSIYTPIGKSETNETIYTPIIPRSTYVIIKPNGKTIPAPYEEPTVIKPPAPTNSSIFNRPLSRPETKSSVTFSPVSTVYSGTSGSGSSNTLNYSVGSYSEPVKPKFVTERVNTMGSDTFTEWSVESDTSSETSSYKSGYDSRTLNRNQIRMLNNSQSRFNNYNTSQSKSSVRVLSSESNTSLNVDILQTPVLESRIPQFDPAVQGSSLAHQRVYGLKTRK